LIMQHLKIFQCLCRHIRITAEDLNLTWKEHCVIQFLYHTHPSGNYWHQLLTKARHVRLIILCTSEFVCHCTMLSIIRLCCRWQG
jgi:hypothetical protein